MLVQLGANRYVPLTAFRLPRTPAGRPPLGSAPVASTNLLLTRLRTEYQRKGPSWRSRSVSRTVRASWSSPVRRRPRRSKRLVSAALREGSGLLSLSDDKGRRFLIHTTKIAYVEIGVADARRVGFGIGAERAKPGGEGR